jgi:hypothetical protein
MSHVTSFLGSNNIPNALFSCISICLPLLPERETVSHAYKTIRNAIFLDILLYTYIFTRMPNFMNLVVVHRATFWHWYMLTVGQENGMEQMKTLWPMTIIERVYFSITRTDV